MPVYCNQVHINSMPQIGESSTKMNYSYAEDGALTDEEMTGSSNTKRGDATKSHESGMKSANCSRKAAKKMNNSNYEIPEVADELLSASRSTKSSKRTERRQAGLPYVSKKGKTVDAKMMVFFSCSPCRFNCEENFPKDEREETHQNFWAAADWQAQSNFILATVTVSEPKRRTVSDGPFRRKATLRYFLNRKQICKNVYLSTLSITSQRVSYMLNEKAVSGVCPPDGRGKSSSSHKLRKDGKQCHYFLDSNSPSNMENSRQRDSHGSDLDAKPCNTDTYKQCHDFNMETDIEGKKEMGKSSCSQNIMWEPQQPFQHFLDPSDHYDMVCSAEADPRQYDMREKCDISDLEQTADNPNTHLESSASRVDVPLPSEDPPPIPSSVKRPRRTKRRKASLSYMNRKGASTDVKKMEFFSCSPCRYNCDDNFSHDEREEIHKNFWAFADWHTQSSFILATVTVSEPKRRTVSDGPFRRKSTIQYFLKEKQVCRGVYLSTLSITSQRVSYILSGKAVSGIGPTNGKAKCLSAHKNADKATKSPNILDTSTECDMKWSTESNNRKDNMREKLQKKDSKRSTKIPNNKTEANYRSAETQALAEGLLAVPGKAKWYERTERRQSGLSYINSKGKTISAKTMQFFSCTPCRLNCQKNFPPGEREEIHAKFWGSADWQAQSNFILATVASSEPKRRTVTARPSRRKATLKYYLNGKQICKRVYLSTLSITSQRVSYMLNEKVVLGACPPDGRGKNAASHNNGSTPKKQLQQSDDPNVSPDIGCSAAADYLLTDMLANYSRSRSLQQISDKFEIPTRKAPSSFTDQSIASTSSMNIVGHNWLGIGDDLENEGDLRCTLPSDAASGEDVLNNSLTLAMEGSPNRPIGFVGDYDQQEMNTSMVAGVVEDLFLARKVAKGAENKKSLYPFKAVIPKEDAGAIKIMKFFDCSPCRHNCATNCQWPEREELHDRFWRALDWQAQSEFILSTIKTNEPRSRLIRDGPYRIKFTRQYFINGKQVCKPVYLSTLSITKKRVSNCLNKRPVSIVCSPEGIVIPFTGNKTPDEDMDIDL